jgi:hypothetical protein
MEGAARVWKSIGANREEATPGPWSEDWSDRIFLLYALDLAGL